MTTLHGVPWPVGILSVVQTPFTESAAVDEVSLERLVADTLEAGVDGLLVPAVASENAYLSLDEVLRVATIVQETAGGSAPVFWGVGSHDENTIVRVANEAGSRGAAGCLVAVPPSLYAVQERIVPYFSGVCQRIDIPLMVQDLQFDGPGMGVDGIVSLYRELDMVRYLKVETVPAGPKYSAVLAATDGNLHVSGGWAVQQMIEALDRGVHAMIPESSMVRIYKQIDRLHRSGDRNGAIDLFNRLLPVLAFANQQLDVSIRFFKRLLVRKGIFQTDNCRMKSSGFDDCQLRVADELIELVLELEDDIKAMGGHARGTK